MVLVVVVEWGVVVEWRCAGAVGCDAIQCGYCLRRCRMRCSTGDPWENGWVSGGVIGRGRGGKHGID